MCKSFKDGYDFIVQLHDATGMLTLRRKNGQACYCPYSEEDYCGSQCPHFVVENCSIIDKKCTLDLTCGKHMLRVVEIL